jgi:hypothetical protein
MQMEHGCTWCALWRLLDCSFLKAGQPASRVRCHIGFGELAMNLPDSHVASTVPVLVDILRDVPLIDFDESLSWEGVCQTVYS